MQTLDTRFVISFPIPFLFHFVSYSGLMSDSGLSLSYRSSNLIVPTVKWVGGYNLGWVESRGGPTGRGGAIIKIKFGQEISVGMCKNG